MQLTCWQYTHAWCSSRYIFTQVRGYTRVFLTLYIADIILWYAWKSPRYVFTQVSGYTFPMALAAMTASTWKVRLAFFIHLKFTTSKLFYYHIFITSKDCNKKPPGRWGSTSFYICCTWKDKRNKLAKLGRCDRRKHYPPTHWLTQSDG